MEGLRAQLREATQEDEGLTAARVALREKREILEIDISKLKKERKEELRRLDAAREEREEAEAERNRVAASGGLTGSQARAMSERAAADKATIVRLEVSEEEGKGGSGRRGWWLCDASADVRPRRRV